MQPGVMTPNHRVSSPELDAPVAEERSFITSTESPASLAVPPLAPAELARAAIEARTVLEAAANAAAEAAEQALAVAVALDEALAQLGEHDAPEAASSNGRAPQAPFGALSPREQEVLALVARGFTNKDIAETLYVSPNTVKTHVASLLHKLDAETRAQLAAIATRQEQHRPRPGQRAGVEPIPG